MNTDRLIQIQTALIGVAAAILLAAIPWAYFIHGDMREVRVEVKRAVEDVKDMAGDIKGMAINSARIDTIERRLDRVEARMP